MKSICNVENKVVLITGAFGLIGTALTERFLSLNAIVVAADINAKKCKRFEKELKNKFPDGKYLVTLTDITHPEQCALLVRQILNKFRRIDVLINNAAIDAKFQKLEGKLNKTRFENFPIEQLERSFDVNIKGLVQVTQSVIKQMLKQGSGNIINVASTYSLVAPNQELYNFGGKDIQFKPVDYVITKSMIPNFTKYIATFYARENIRCNAIAPHGIFNDHDKKFIKNFSALSPMGRMSDVDEVTGAFVFLASDESSYMTGSVVTVDGGWTAW